MIVIGDLFLARCRQGWSQSHEREANPIGTPCLPVPRAQAMEAVPFEVAETLAEAVRDRVRVTSASRRFLLMATLVRHRFLLSVRILCLLSCSRSGSCACRLS